MAHPAPDIFGAAVDRQGQVLFHVFRDQDPLLQVSGVPAGRVGMDLQFIEARAAEEFRREVQICQISLIAPGRIAELHIDREPFAVLGTPGQPDLIVRGVFVRGEGAVDGCIRSDHAGDILCAGQEEVSVRGGNGEVKGILADDLAIPPGGESEGIYAGIGAGPVKVPVFPAAVAVVPPARVARAGHVHLEPVRAGRVGEEGDVLPGQDLTAGKVELCLRLKAVVREGEGDAGLIAVPADAVRADGQEIVAGRQKRCGDGEVTVRVKAEAQHVFPMIAAVVVPFPADLAPVPFAAVLRGDGAGEPFAAGEGSLVHGHVRLVQPAVG